MSFANIDDGAYDDLKIIIRDETPQGLAKAKLGPDLKFKALLENHSVGVQLKEQNLSFTPLSFVNDKVATRTTYSIKLKFNVFSENSEDCFTNYANLHNLLYTIKPKFIFTNEQYLPVTQNNTGLITIKFKGLPALRSLTNKRLPYLDPADRLTIHLTSFSFDINNEMGYYNAPFGKDKIKDEGDMYFGEENYVINDGTNNSRLVPIGYSLNIEGNVLLPFEDTVRIETSSRERYMETGRSTVAPLDDSGETPFWKGPGVFDWVRDGSATGDVPALRRVDGTWTEPDMSDATKMADAAKTMTGRDGVPLDLKQGRGNTTPLAEQVISSQRLERFKLYIQSIEPDINIEEYIARANGSEISQSLRQYENRVRLFPQEFNDDGTFKADVILDSDESWWHRVERERWSLRRKLLNAARRFIDLF
jgi:hypothetical protein